MLGGWFVDAGSWRVAFATMLPVALLTLVVTALRVPNPPVMRRAPPIDWPGAVLVTAGLFGIVTGIITIGSSSTSPVALGAGAAALIGFVVHERRTTTPMVPPALFASRSFVGVNLLTLLLYLGVTGAFFVLPFNLVQVHHYSSTATGAAFLPFALLVGVLSPRVGTLSDRIGARPLLVAGPTITGVGLAAFALPGVGGSYWATFLAPMVLTGFGMALTVTPLTTSVLASVEPAAAGIASGVNNTAARVGTVLAVAIVGVLVAVLYGRALDRRLATAGVPAGVSRVLVSQRQNLANVTIPEAVAPADRASVVAVIHDAFLESFRGAVLLCAAFVLLGAGLAAYTITASDTTRTEPATALPTCEHVAAIVDPQPRSQGCAECVRTGDSWVHLRVCLSCGYVGCCDSSKNRHATKHFWSSRHPIVRSLEPGEDWRWCYVDEVAV
jgi:MFS family permease